jgi:hypothetical protein
MFWGFCNRVGRSGEDDRPDFRSAAFPEFGSNRGMVEIEGPVRHRGECERECQLNIRKETLIVGAWINPSNLLPYPFQTNIP